jgi:hypothetical protein
MFQTFLVVTLLAVWQNPTPVYVGPGDQTIDMVISDDEGGAAVLWHDAQTGWEFMNVIDSAGNLKWGSGGVAVLMMGDTITQNPDMFLDSLGNYWVALEAHWYTPSEGQDIYVQKISPTGQRLFGDRGVAVCTAQWSQSLEQLCLSGEGAIIVWMDESDTSNFTQRINSSGTTLWSNNGIPISATPHGWFANCVSDGKNGAFFIFRQWIDSKNHIAFQRIDSLGTKLWGDSGIYYGVGRIWSEVGFFYGHMTEVKEGGFIFFYNTYEGEYKTQRVDSLGGLVWNPSGVVLDTHFTTSVSPPSSNGLFVVGGSTNSEPHEAVYCNRLLLDGSTPWGNASKAVWDEFAYDPRETIVPTVTEDGIVAWRDVYDAGDPYGDRYIEQGIMAQRVDNSGSILWPEEVHVTGTQGQSPQVVGTNDKAGIITWNDNRNGNVDLYATWIDSLGNLPPGIEEEPMPILSPLNIELVGGNIINKAARLRYSVNQNAFVNVVIYDVSGQLVRILEQGKTCTGTHELTWDRTDNAGCQVSSGVYFIRVAALGRAVTAKVITLK